MNKINCLSTSFGIYGTCVTVDSFLFSNDSEKKLIDKVAMRDSTIFGSNNQRPDISLSGLRHTSSLHTMWLNTIYDGKIFSFMKDNAGEYCIVDLTDERFDMFCYKGSVFNEHFFKTSNFFELVDKEDCTFFSHDKYSLNEMREIIKCFCSRLMEIYSPDKIILNEFYLADSYIKNGKIHCFTDESSLKKIEKCQQYFSIWYTWMKEFLPGCKVVKFKKKYYAYDGNPRGLSPCHNTMDYYQDTYQQLLDIVESDYKRQRKIEVMPFSGKIGKYNVKNFEIWGGEKYVSKIFARLENYINFSGKRILWISRHEVSHALARGIKVEKLVHLFPYTNNEEIINFRSKHGLVEAIYDKYTAPKEMFRMHNFAYYVGKITQLTNDFLDIFDLIFLDDMEYLDNVGVSLDNLYKCLKRSGVLIAKTGRTWSASDGSKWKINEKNNYLSNEKLIPQYAHLIPQYHKIVDILKTECSMSEIQSMDTAVKIQNGCSELNRLFYEDYKTYVEKSLFTKKRICPMYKQKIDQDLLEDLKKRYAGYSAFEYKSLLIYCQK